MGSIRINTFRGQESRDQKLLKPNTFAECAINASLQDGALSAIPCPEEILTAPFTARSIFDSPQCGIIDFAEEAYIEFFQDRIYVSDERGVSKSYDEAGLCNNLSGRFNLGMPSPSLPPSVSSGVNSGGRFEPRQYMYTFVSKRAGCLVESPPSPISRSTNCADNATLSNLQSGPAGYGITHIRIYRFDAGWKSGSEGRVENNSGALIVAELPNGTTSYFDNNPLSDPDMIGLLTYDMESMPRNPSGIGSTAFSLFSWVGKELYISVDGMPELRRKNGRFCFDYDIISAKYWNGSIYVFTDRYNYRIDESPGEGGVSYSNPPYKFEKIIPIINKWSISVGNTGVFYQSSSGIAVLSGNDNFIVSTGILNTSQWKSYKSVNIKTFVYQQYLFIFSRDWDFAHIFEFEDGVTQERSFSNHVLYPYNIHAMHIDDDGQLIFSSDNSVYKFIETDYCPAFCFDEYSVPACTECCPYDYKMMIENENQIGDYAMGYLKIDPRYGNVTFRLWDRSCGNRIVYEETFGGCGEHQFRLPACHITEEHMVQLEGCAKVYELRLGNSSKQMGLNR